MPPSEIGEDPRQTLAELSDQIKGQLGRQLVGLYLFGSLAAGDFYPGRSDLDLLAVLDEEVADINALRELHGTFETAHPMWRDRIEVLYISRKVLETFAGEPRGRVMRISPGEPLHLRELDGAIGWIIDWRGVLSEGEILLGPMPLTLGPPISSDRLRAAVMSQLREWGTLVRRSEVAYVPAQQGYIVASVCRALYSLATGEQTSKEKAVAWFAECHPDEAEYVWVAYRAYRADVRAPHERLIQFVDDAADEATVPIRTRP